MLSGRRAFRGDTAIDTMTAILKEIRPTCRLPSGTSRRRWRALSIAVWKRLRLRVSSRRAISAFALEAISGVSTPSGVVGLVVPRRSTRTRVVLALFVLVLAAGAAWLAGPQLSRTAEQTAAPSSVPTFASLTGRRGYIPNARFALDGQTVVDGAAWDAQPLEIYMSRTNSLEARPLGLTSSSVLAVSSTERLPFQWGVISNMPEEAAGAPSRASPWPAACRAP